MKKDLGTIGVIDYGGGNLRSVLNMLSALGFENATTVEKAGDFAGIDQLIFPGVGAFGDCAKQMDARDLRAPLKDWLAEGKPYFGICLGYQILFERSEECPEVDGLGHFAGDVVRFPNDMGLKIPHMGWNNVSTTQITDPVWANIGSDAYFYFVHSFFPKPADETLIDGRAEYGVEFAASIRRPNLVATQFHPERSQAAGLRLIDNFLRSTCVSGEMTENPLAN